MSLYLLDLVGVFAFAFYGAMKGLRCSFNIFGILACALLTAFAGGTVREIILNNQPIYLHDYTYMYVAIAAASSAVLTHRYYHPLHRIMIVADAVGLATFAFIGAHRADEAGLGVAAMCLFAVLTAAGGGMVCDIVIGKRPGAFLHDFYIAPALLLALGYFVLHEYMTLTISIFLIAVTVALRLVVLSRHRIMRTFRHHTVRRYTFTKLFAALRES